MRDSLRLSRHPGLMIATRTSNEISSIRPAVSKISAGVSCCSTCELSAYVHRRRQSWQRERVGGRLRCRRKDGRQDCGTGFHECPKIAQARAHGGPVKLIEGSRTDVEAAAIRQASQDRLYASHNWQAFFLKARRRSPLNSGKAWALRPPIM